MAESGSGNGKLAFANAARTAFVTFCVVIATQLAKALINDLFDGKWQIDWTLTLVISAAFGGIVFLWIFVSGYISLRAAAPADAILNRDAAISPHIVDAISGFVGMEYYFLILNRTYLVFAAPGGLYGWKVEGPVTTARPLFYEPYQKLLDDPELMRDRVAIEDLSRLKGGFVIPDAEIANVISSDRSKWGMGGIRHSGRIRIVMTNGKSREFILLGSVDADAVRARISSSIATRA